MRIIEVLSQSDRAINQITQRKVGCQLLIMPTTAHVKRPANYIKDEHYLVQTLHRHLSGIPYQSLLTMRKVEVGVHHPPVHPPRHIRIRTVDEDENVALSVIIIRRVTALAPHCQRAILMVKESLN